MQTLPFAVRDKVVIHGTGVEGLDGESGTVVGFHGEVDSPEDEEADIFVIILFDDQNDEDDPASCIPIEHVKLLVTQ